MGAAGTITESCLVRIGRTGVETHRGEIRVEIRPDGPTHRRRRVVAAYCRCQAMKNSGRAMLRSIVVPMPGTDPDAATCKLCR
jgi:hypothetical protein